MQCTPTWCPRAGGTSASRPRSRLSLVDSCAGIWSIIGASASDPVGTATLDDITITTSTAANSAEFITNLVVEDVTVGGTPVTA